MKTLSVVIPVKNGMPYLKETIDSVLAEHEVDLEIIISDDHSIDGTSDYLKTLKDPRIRIVQPHKSMKVDQHWSFVTSLATGTYTKLLCADDLILPGGITRQIAQFASSPEVDLVASRRRIINESGRVILNIHGLANLVGVYPGKKILRSSFLKGTNILGEPSALIFRTDKLKEVLPWNAKAPFMLDFELYARLLPSISVGLLSSTDSCFRVHGNSISSTHRKSHFAQFVSLYKELCLDQTSYYSFSGLENLQFKVNTWIKGFARNIIFILAKWK